MLCAIAVQPSAEGLAARAETGGLARIGFSRPWISYLAVFATGFLAIGYQLIWFRVIGTLLKPSAYVFSTVLAVYLLGIAVGSFLMSRRISRARQGGGHRQMFFKLNAGIALVTVATFVLLYRGADLEPFRWMLETSFAQPLHPPYHPIYAIGGDTLGAQATSVYLLLDLLIWPLLIVFPATLMMGASFPLIAAMAIEADPREGWRAGSVYAANILGNVLGALLTGFVLFPLIGTELTLIAFSLVGLLWCIGIAAIRGRPLGVPARLAVIAVLAVATVLLMPKRAEFYDMIHPELADYPGKLVTEDVDGVVVSYRGPDSEPDRSIVYISGSAHATYPHAAYQTEALEAITYAEAVTDVLVIGFGGGDLTATLLKVPGVEHVTVVELSDALVKNLRQIPFYQRILGDPRVELIVEDGRRYLQTNPRVYDLVVMDPLESTTAYANNIYSKEFFEIVRSRLKPSGVLMTWMNEYLVTPRTLAAVFRTMRCYYFFCLSSETEMQANPQRREALWQSIDPEMQAKILERVNQARYVKGDRSFIVKQTEIYPINTDFDPVSEYYVGYNLKRHFRMFRGGGAAYPIAD